MNCKIGWLEMLTCYFKPAARGEFRPFITRFAI